MTPQNKASADWPGISTEIWDMKYRLKGLDGAPDDASFADTVERVAKAVAHAEIPRLRKRWAAAFQDAMADREFIPGGRVLAGAGAGRRVTLFNCFVMGRIEDDLGGIFDAVKEAALTMQAGGGIGYDFSTLRPRGALVRSIGADASGPVSFMDVWDAMCRTIMSAGARRGAMMATLRCDHPDVEDFIEAKRDPQRLRNFNLSVLVTDAFVAAVKADAAWDLVFEGRIYRTLPARALWSRLMRATFDVAEPGVIFIDRINAQNNLGYCETIAATNPCGEQPLPAYGACLLGALNLAKFVREPFSERARLDEARLIHLAGVATRFLDNVIDVSRYPLPVQKREALAKRRIGLGVTGFADALIFLGVRYGSAAAVELIDRWLGLIKRAAYGVSADLASEKGAFPLSDGIALTERPNIMALPKELRAQIGRSGLRNGVLTTIAPTGTTSLLAGNVSSGIEPVFDFTYMRRVLAADGERRDERVEDYAYRVFRQTFGPNAPLGDAFVAVGDLRPKDHLAIQAAAQRHVDSAISKTINCPESISFGDFESIYLDAHALGLKGCTTYRPNAVTGSVLSSETMAAVPVVAPDVTGGRAVARPVARALPAVAAGTADVIYMAKPLAREPVLAGYTYKLKWPRSEHASYITINDIEHDGRRRPFEIFINSKNLEHTAWTLALTRMISAVFRRGGDVGFVVEELKAVFDPQGGAWMEGHYVPSLQAAIGGVIEAHLARIGLARQEAAQTAAAGHSSGDASFPANNAGPAGSARVMADDLLADGMRRIATGSAKICPRCSQMAYVQQDGCATCRNCGYSQCD